MNYVDLQQIPIIIPDKQAIQILDKVEKQNNVTKKKRHLLAAFLLSNLFIHFK
jgi:hypothetical protein